MDFVTSAASSVKNLHLATTPAEVAAQAAAIWRLLDAQRDPTEWGVVIIPFLAGSLHGNPALLSALLEHLPSDEATEEDADSTESDALFDNFTMASRGIALVGVLVKFIMAAAPTLSMANDRNTITVLERVIKSLLRCPKASELVARHPSIAAVGYLGGSDAKMFQQLTLLGALSSIRLHAKIMSRNVPIFHPQYEELTAAAQYIVSPTQTAESVRSLVGLHQTLLDNLVEFFRSVVQLFLQTPSTRAATLHWQSRFLQLNSGHSKMQPPYHQLASVASMAVVSHTLIQLALPAVKRADYFPTLLPANYFFLPQEVCLTPHPPQYERVCPDDAAGPPTAADAPIPQWTPDHTSPRTHLTFLALRASGIFVLGQLDKLQHLQQLISHPGYPEEQKLHLRAQLCRAAVLFCGVNRRAAIIDFSDRMALWLIHLLQADKSGKLPSDTEPPRHWALLHQQDIEAILTVIDMYMLNEYGLQTSNPHQLSFPEVYNTVGLSLLLMGNRAYYPKPHAHRHFGVFLYLLMQVPQLKRGFFDHPWCDRLSAVGCLRCYVMLEHCDLQDRYQQRLYLVHCIELLLNNTMCSELVRRASDSTDDLLERFSKVLLGEVTARTSGTLDLLRRMQGIEAEHDASSLQRDDFKQLMHQLKGENQVGGKSLDVLSSMAVRFSRGMARNLLVQQVAQTMMKLVIDLAGPNRNQWKLKHVTMADVGFDPRTMMLAVIQCFRAFSRTSPMFHRFCCEAVQSLDDFDEAVLTIVRFNLASDMDQAWIKTLNDQLHVEKKVIDDEEEAFEDVPNFAECPILQDILVDPVVLPPVAAAASSHPDQVSSGESPVDGEAVKAEAEAEAARPALRASAWFGDVSTLIVVNRSSIEHHLLSESTNPFNRTPLSMALLNEFNQKPDIVEFIDNLKRRVLDWRTQRLIEWRQKKALEKQSSAAS